MTLDVGKMALGVGTAAPDFTLKDQNNQEIHLREVLDRRSALLVFYPLAFTGTCQGELHAVRDNLSAFQNERVQVLTISVDSPYAHKVWADRESYDFPLLSDFWPHGAVARSYGVFNEKAGFANRGTFLVDPAGVIRYAEVQGPGQARDQGPWRAAIEAL